MEYREITGENFYFTEMKNAGKFLVENQITENLKEIFKERDILDCISKNNFNRKFQTVNKRLNSLTSILKYYLVNSDTNTTKFIIFYSILCNERIVAEFMDEVIREKYNNYDYYLKDSEFIKFLENKAEQSEIIENWSDPTKKKIILKLKNFLTESGFIKKEKEKLYKILKPLIISEVIDEIKENGSKSILKIMLY